MTTMNAKTERIADNELINVILHALQAIRDVSTHDIIKYECSIYPEKRAVLLDPLRMMCINVVCKDDWKHFRSNAHWLMLMNVHKSVNDMIFNSLIEVDKLPKASIRRIVYAILPMKCEITERLVYPCVCIRRRLVFHEWKVCGLPECPVKSYINGSLKYSDRYLECLKTLINEERRKRGLPPNRS